VRELSRTCVAPSTSVPPDVPENVPGSASAVSDLKRGRWDVAQTAVSHDCALEKGAQSGIKVDGH